MGNGRTRPLLVEAEDADNTPYEVVLKLRGREVSYKSQIAELVSARLADHLGIDVPMCAVVEVSDDFADICGAESHLVRGSLGENFGSIHLGTSFTTWMPGRPLRNENREKALGIFAFDLLIQNPDRRVINPNLWTRNDSLGVYDHEQAFSFLYLPILGGPTKPWLSKDLPAFSYLRDHVFYSGLRGSQPDIAGLDEKLEGLTDDWWSEVNRNIPESWQHGHTFCKDIGEYLSEARNERSSFIQGIQHLLR